MEPTKGNRTAKTAKDAKKEFWMTPEKPQTVEISKQSARHLEATPAPIRIRSYTVSSRSWPTWRFDFTERRHEQPVHLIRATKTMTLTPER